MSNLLIAAITIGFFLFGCYSARGEGQDPLKIYPENYKVIVENEHVRVLDFQLKKGAKETTHMHPAHVVYVLTGFKIRFTFPDGNTAIRETKDGDVLYSDAVAHASENIGQTDASGILVELKSSAGQKTATAIPADPNLLT